MAMKNLKNDSDGNSLCCMGDYMPSQYPYGLTISLNEDVCEQLGITKALKAGSEVRLTARAIVTSSTESVENDGDDSGNDVSLQLQITDMSVTPGGMVKNAASELYGD